MFDVLQNVSQLVPFHPSAQLMFTCMDKRTLSKTPFIVNRCAATPILSSYSTADVLNSSKTSSISGSVNGGSKSGVRAPPSECDILT